MKARDAVGRRIVKVYQRRFWSDHSGRWIVEVASFELDNGTRLVMNPVEIEFDMAVEVLVVKPKKEISK